MDYYLYEENCYKRLRDEYIKYGKLIFCIDFDDTIYDYHNLGRTYEDVIRLLHRWENYSEVIVLTSCAEDKYEGIERYLKERNIKYHGINCESSISFGGRKPYANAYIDDRGGLPSIYRILDKLITEIENGTVSSELPKAC